ncbi:MAG: hypothetical protein IKQ04_00525 [Oscillospiraceae bacterium]|nr:hypothetical protein [Oscillospiraceae bacterium]
MAEEEQFTMTVVQMKRRPRPGAEAPEGEHAAAPHHSGGHSRPHDSPRGDREDSPSHTVRRHYNDFGTVNLGVLEEEPDAAAQAAGDEPSKGAQQRAFYDKYDAALQRKYSTRNKSKVTRILAAAALMALVVLLLVFGLGSLSRQTGETLPKPEVETIPIVTLG